MNFKHLILLSLFVYATFAAQCNTIVGSCNRCQAAGCDWCDQSGFNFYSCVDAGTCPSGKPVQANGTCDVNCADYTKCTDCVANTTCSYCSTSGFGSCMTGTACNAPYVKIETCPKVCDAAPAIQAGGLCNIPYQIASNDSFSLLFKTCTVGGLGYPSDQNATAANCSDPCTLEYAKLPESCLSKQRLLTCGAFCPACDADLTLAGYVDYFPCQSFCDDVNASCNSLLSDKCKINLAVSCSKNTAKCNKLTGVTTNAQSNACSPASSTSAAVSSAGQSSNGATSAGQSSNGATSAASTKASSSTSASTTGSAGSIFACVILGFFALLI